MTANARRGIVRTPGQPGVRWQLGREREFTFVQCANEEFRLQPTVFYHWLKQFFENGAAAFQRPGDSCRKREQQRIATLEKKLRTKDVTFRVGC